MFKLTRNGETVHTFENAETMVATIRDYGAPHVHKFRKSDPRNGQYLVATEGLPGRVVVWKITAA